MSSEEIRQSFLEFFKKKGHKIVPSSSLIPLETDPTVLFTTAGMHPLVPYLLGEKHPAGKRLANIQKCIRTGDIDEVGDDVHLTFFEMLGNWSLGDYFKKEAIEWSFEFLTKHLNIPLEKLAVSCFAGDDEVPRDEESAKIWELQGIPKERIYFLGRDDNWWGPAGQTGPCGPCTEMFYWVGKGELSDLVTGDNKEGWVEIWNDVFMEYNKISEGKFVPLSQKNVDTGMGMERTLAVLNGFDNIYDTELFVPIVKKIEEISGKKYGESDGVTRAMRIVADHLKAATFLLAEGLEPSNVERGYVLRRLIRRAVRYEKQLGINDIFTFKIAEVVVDIYKAIYPEVDKNKAFITNQLIQEEEKFAKTLAEGIKKAKKIIEQKTPIVPEKFRQIMQTPNKREIIAQVLLDLRENKDSRAYLKFPIPLTLKEISQATITAKEAFDLYQSFGFHQDMMLELAQENNLFVDRFGFRQELEKHQKLSRAGAEQKFKGGLADHSEQTIKYHTAAHLMLAALRKVLGEHVVQKGSNITSERLRFDFSHSEKVTPEQIKQIEDMVNEKIRENLPVEMQEMTLEEAKAQNATGVFEHKYGEQVKVYSIGDFSKEICGGPHVQKTGELGHFKIVKEEASSSGVRRIKAVLD